MIPASRTSGGFSSASQTALQASSEIPPSNTLSWLISSRCPGSSDSQDQSSVARSERWRSGRSRGPKVSSSRRFSNRSSSDGSGSSRARSAASSIASGRPSSRAQIASTTVESGTQSGRAAATREVNSAAALVTASGWTR